MFASSLDQVGAFEMRELVRQTGGLIAMADLFDNEMFQESFKKVFDQDQAGNLKMGFNAVTEVQTSKELKICGAIGHCTSMGKKGPSVSETEIGVGGTSAWKICGLDPNASIAFYFDVVNQPTSSPASRGHRGCLQFLTQYQNSVGQRVLRVTTISRPYVITHPHTQGIFATNHATTPPSSFWLTTAFVCVWLGAYVDGLILRKATLPLHRDSTKKRRPS